MNKGWLWHIIMQVSLNWMSQWQSACVLNKQLKPLSKECLITGYHQIISLLLANSREGWCWERMTQNVWYVSDDGNLQSPCSGDTGEIKNHIYGKNQIWICTTKPTLFFSSPVICLCLQKKFSFHFLYWEIVHLNLAFSICHKHNCSPRTSLGI